MDKHIFIDNKEDYLRRKFHRNVFLFFVKWILTIIFIYIIFSGNLIYLMKGTNFFIATLILLLLFVCGYSWHVDIHLFLKRRKQKRSLITDPLIIEFIIIIILGLLIVWYSFPNILQKNNSKNSENFIPQETYSENFDVKGINFEELGDNVGDFCSGVCGEVKVSGYGNLKNIRVIECQCDGNPIYVDYSGQRITQEEVSNRICNERKARGLAC